MSYQYIDRVNIDSGSVKDLANQVEVIGSSARYLNLKDLSREELKELAIEIHRILYYEEGGTDAKKEPR